MSGMKNSPETLAKRNQLRKHWRDTIDPASFPHEIERICRDCKQLKMCKWSSGFTQTGKPDYRTRCNDCQNKYLSDLGRAKRSRMTSQALDRKYLGKKRCVDYLGGRCVRCGYDRCIKAMTFHHRDPAAKGFAISQMLDRAWAVLKPELDKCDLLCFNCHMEEHCSQDQATRTALGVPKKHGCMPHSESGDSDGEIEQEAA
jgi:hypothetical protein